MIRRRPRAAEYDDDVPLLNGGQVIVEDDGPEFTGLLDANGHELYRHKTKHPIGFDINPDHYKPRKQRRSRK